MPTTQPGKPKLGADGNRMKTFVLDTKAPKSFIDNPSSNVTLQN